MNDTLLSTFCVLFTFEIVKEIFDTFFVYFFGGLAWFDHSFAYVIHFVFLSNVWIRTQRAAVASRRYQLSLSSP